MEPVPGTFEAIQRLMRSGDTHIAVELLRIAREVRQVVPEVVGLSIGLPADNLTFTLISDSDLASEMDAVQYVDDGPCLLAVELAEPVATDLEGLFDEQRWQMFARAAAARGVASTLSLPVVVDGRAVAGINLYASTPDAFSGHHEQLAAVCGAWAPGAVTNADLAFRTLQEAAATPNRMVERDVVDQAIGMLAQSQNLSTGDAEQRIRQAATRAGISEAQAARAVIGVLSMS
jgi:GAF domain-containing protein